MFLVAGNELNELDGGCEPGGIKKRLPSALLKYLHYISTACGVALNCFIMLQIVTLNLMRWWRGGGACYLLCFVAV